MTPAPRIQRAFEWALVGVLVMWAAALFVFGPELLVIALRTMPL